MASRAEATAAGSFSSGSRGRPESADSFGRTPKPRSPFRRVMRDKRRFREKRVSSFEKKLVALASTAWASSMMRTRKAGSTAVCS